jgi:hypothetical protein
MWSTPLSRALDKFTIIFSAKILPIYRLTPPPPFSAITARIICLAYVRFTLSGRAGANHPYPPFVALIPQSTTASVRFALYGRSVVVDFGKCEAKCYFFREIDL